MGQKVNPIAFRTGIMEGWRSRWYASKKEFADLLVEDYKIRQYIKNWRPKEDRDPKGRRDDKPIYSAIAKIEIERTRDEVKVILHTARPGVLIGRKGERVEELQNELQTLTGRRINIDIKEITKPEVVAQLVAEDIAEQLSRRASFRRAMKRAMDMAMEAGAKGIKVQLSGRLGGAEMSRREKAIMGSLPLSTLRAKIDYGFAIAKIPQGVIGVQVWINQGMYEETTDGADAQTGQISKKPKRTYKR
ncbi:MAG: 30S ribosomal protein S3 [Thermoguttaceae bacterium]|nr:30S ribosomal protein S3 [Thermoguttaceae bacterium]MDW8037590.1 30S ribosomal protein S3 [Thermoguttaceae bacterium]